MAEIDSSQPRMHQIHQMKGYVGNGVMLQEGDVVLAVKTNWQPFEMRMSQVQAEEFEEKLDAVLGRTRP